MYTKQIIHQSYFIESLVYTYEFRKKLIKIKSTDTTSTSVYLHSVII